MRRIGLGRVASLYRWYTSFSLLYLYSFSMFFVYLLVYDRFLIEGEELIEGFTGAEAWNFLFRCALSPYEPFIFYVHAALTVAILVGYEAKSGYSYIGYIACTGRGTLFAVKLLSYTSLVTLPPLLAKMLLVFLWAPGLVLRDPPGFLVALASTWLGIASASLIAFPLFTLLVMVLGRPSYAVTVSTVYLYLFENPFSRSAVTPISLSRSYILSLVVGPGSCAPLLSAALLAILLEAAYLSARGEVSWP